jgi:hypothetical protein
MIFWILWWRDSSSENEKGERKNLRFWILGITSTQLST